MKKCVAVMLCLLLLGAMMLPAAAEPEVVFTDDTSFATGGRITVDIVKMTDMDATIYEAWLEGDVVYHWYVDGVENPEYGGPTMIVPEEFENAYVHVEVVCYDIRLFSGRKQVTAGENQPTTQPTTALSTQPTTAPTTQPTTAPTTQPTTAPSTLPATQSGTARPADGITLPWWGIVLIVLSALCIGGVTACIFVKKK